MNNQVKSKLTVKQEKFITSYVQTGNATQSAISAGYPETSAHSIATENLQKPAIIARKLELEEQINSPKIADVKERKERLSEIARARLTDYITPEGIKIDKDSPNTAAFSGIKTRVKYYKKGIEPEVITDIDLHNPIAAIAELNKMDKIYDTGAINYTDIKIIVIREGKGAITGGSQKELSKGMGSTEKG